MMRDREATLELIRETYEDAMRNTHLRFAVYCDKETGKSYQFSDTAGGNSEPESAWSGQDEKICEFCFQCWRPEDNDDMFRENLISYLNEAQIAKLTAKEQEGEEELSGRELAEMFPDAYNEYCEEVINNEMSEFCPEDYLD